MEIKNVKKKRAYSLIAIMIGLPLAIAGAASNNLLLGGVFGSLLTIGIDFLFDTFKLKVNE